MTPNTLPTRRKQLLVPGNNPTANSAFHAGVVLGPESVATDEEQVDVTVPQPYRLSLDDHTVVRYAAGIQPMPVSHAEHWFSKAQGVIPYKRLKEEKKQESKDETAPSDAEQQAKALEAEQQEKEKQVQEQEAKAKALAAADPKAKKTGAPLAKRR